VLAGRYGQRTNDWDLIRELWPAIERALAWLDGPGDMDGDGFIEYVRAESTGLANQGWKDSHDSIFHADGRLAEGPIALVEVQGYAYAAKLAGAACAAALGLTGRSEALIAQAERFRSLFEERFWCEDIGLYALALDGKKVPCRVRTSNAGHALWSGITSPERSAAVASALLDTDFFSGWGVRTVARGEARYNPMSYHNGSIWPHDNALLAQGLARTGAKQGVAEIFDALIQATTYLDHRRIPELYCGFRRRRGRGPTLYPSACSPQAWAAAAPFSLIQALLGLELCPGDKEVRLNNPIVPATAGEFTIRGLQLGGAVADFAVRPTAKGVAVDVLRAEGGIRVAIFGDRPGEGRTRRFQPRGVPRPA
jgi:glycogen debranching enzyme